MDNILFSSLLPYLFLPLYFLFLYLTKVLLFLYSYSNMIHEFCVLLHFYFCSFRASNFHEYKTSAFVHTSQPSLCYLHMPWLVQAPYLTLQTYPFPHNTFLLFYDILLDLSNFFVPSPFIFDCLILALYLLSSLCIKHVCCKIVKHLSSIAQIENARIVRVLENMVHYNVRIGNIKVAHNSCADALCRQPLAWCEAGEVRLICKVDKAAVGGVGEGKEYREYIKVG